MNYKIQALNGFNMYFDQIVNIFKSRYESGDKIILDELSAATGLNRRKVRIILNFFADIGLSEKRTLKKTQLGEVIHKNDDFLQNEGTLWLLHYLQSTNEYLIIWNRVLNYLHDVEQVKKEELLVLFDDIKNNMSEYTYKHHIGKEIRTILDAYSNQRYSKLNMLEEEDDKYLVHRNPELPSTILLCAIIIYKQRNYPGATAVDINEICTAHNSPGRIFLLDEYVVRRKLEELKNSGVISIESRGDLDQIRFQDNMNFLTILEQYYNR